MKAIISGPQIPTGHVPVSGAKNSSSRILSASLLSSGEITLRNFPGGLIDIRSKVSFLNRFGASIAVSPSESTAVIKSSNFSFLTSSDFHLPVRTTYLLAAAGLLRDGIALIPYPGGCKIGTRGYDLHVLIWKLMGCSVEETPDLIRVEGRLKGAIIDLPFTSVGATENALICASIAKGETEIRNAYITPEINDLINFLVEIGASIKIEGNSLIRIHGVNSELGTTDFSIMPDRIEALTWILFSAVSRGSVTILNVPFSELEIPLIHIRECGIDIFRSPTSAIVCPDSIRPNGIQPFELACGTHPGVHTDMQSFFTFLALFAEGRSTIHDFRYPERIGFAYELMKMAPGRVQAKPGIIRIAQGSRPRGTHVSSCDLRSSMALIMTAICSDGISQISGVEMALRGYNDLPTKLSRLGIDCKWSE